MGWKESFTTSRACWVFPEPALIPPWGSDDSKDSSQSAAATPEEA